MVSQRDIYASAKLLIHKHGSNAEDLAMKKMTLRMERDDLKGASVWLEIMSAIDNLTIRKQQGNLH